MASAVALFVAPAAGNAQGPDWAVEFRMIDSTVGAGETMVGITTGRAVISKGRVRLEMKGGYGAISMPRMASGDEVSMIVEDNGRLITYLVPKDKRYMQFNPRDLVKQMQKMVQELGAAIKLDVSGPGPKLENLGRGPVMLGHETVHYRMTTGVKMTIGAMGERETMETSSTTDQYFAPDLGELMDPFSSMKSMREASSVFGGVNIASIDKVWAVQAGLPKAPELRAEQRMVMSRSGVVTSVKTIREITKIARLKAPLDIFVVPTGYKKIDMAGPMSPPTR
jgi:hypothetical protein